MTARPLQISVSEKIGTVSGLFIEPPFARVILVLGHGAGAGMTHPFMEELAQALAEQKIATLRYQFPYMERGSKRPDSPKIIYPTILAAIAKAQELKSDLPLYLGGKSFGGRMSSQFVAIEALEVVKGLVFFGFPLHAIGKPSSKRGNHLKEVKQPMLFLQGTRDKLAEVELIEAVCKDLPNATLQFFEGADHSFKMLKRSGKTQSEVIIALGESLQKWSQEQSWSGYYKRIPLQPRKTLLRALDYFKENPPMVKTAIDLGCGKGNDTLTLLEQSWSVYAIDASAKAIELLEEGVNPSMRANLKTDAVSFEETKWELTTLVNASFALPFCPKERFREVWKNIVASIRIGGVFTGHFFGIKDEWQDLMLIDKQDLEWLFEGFELKVLNETEDDRATSSGVMKHWHIFEVMAVKK